MLNYVPNDINLNLLDCFKKKDIKASMKNYFHTHQIWTSFRELWNSEINTLGIFFPDSSFILLIWHITLIDICLIDIYILNQPCIPRVNPTWACCIIRFICCWIRLTRILLRSFHLYLWGILACSYLFLWYFCLVLVSE